MNCPRQRSPSTNSRKNILNSLNYLLQRNRDHSDRQQDTTISVLQDPRQPTNYKQKSPLSNDQVARIPLSGLMFTYVSHITSATISVLTIQTNLPKFRTTQFRDVRRTHSEFSKLSEHLISSNPEALVPAVPPSLTSAGAGTDEDETRVKAAIQRWLNNVCSNDVLIRDEEMVFFVESDFGYSPVVRMKQPATGVRRKVLKQFAPPPDDTPELHEARPVVKSFYLNTLDSGQKLERVVKSRRGKPHPHPPTLPTKLTQF
jgi:hypothetical protein